MDSERGDSPFATVRAGVARWGVGAAVVVGIAIVVIGAAVTAFAPRGDSIVVAAPTATAAGMSGGDPEVNAAGGILFVHVVGAVVRPGLYELHDGARVVDAVAAAGGYAETADQSSLNLARSVSDGEQLVVPVVGQAPAAVPGGAPAAGAKVNINTADATGLETLPRVGPAMAERIIQWREANGAFSSIEDLLSVTGIGQKTFDGLKDLVTT